MTVSLLPDRLCLLRFPRQDLELCSHAILKHVLFRRYNSSSSSNRQQRQQDEEPLFSYIDNSLEISIFGDAKAIARDFDKELCPRLEISSHIYRALQVDNDDTFNSSRICTIVEPLAKAGVSIFYMSTYQMDLLFVQEDRLSIVFTTLFKNGLHMALDQDLGNTPPDSPIQDNLDPMKREMHDIMNKDHHTPGMIEGIEKAPPSYAVGDLQVKHVPVNSLATPPGSRNSTYMSDGTDDGDIDENIVSDVNLVHASAQQLMPLDIISAQRRGRGAVSTENYQEEEYSEAQLPKASPTTATTLELRQQANRTLPLNTLRCVGLNTDLEAAYQPWILKIIKILFYHDKVKDEAVCAGRGPTHDAPRFFSFTATSECVSMITDTYILEEFEEHELFMDNETCPLRLIQLDLHRFGLDKYGIIHSVARPLTEAGIELLYLSTFSTANILVAEHRLSDAERILSGSGASTPQELA